MEGIFETQLEQCQYFVEEMEDDDRNMSNHTPQSNVTTYVQDN
jgi:hypothetical protein